MFREPGPGCVLKRLRPCSSVRLDCFSLAVLLCLGLRLDCVRASRELGAFLVPPRGGSCRSWAGFGCPTVSVHRLVTVAQRRDTGRDVSLFPLTL